MKKSYRYQITEEIFLQTREGTLKWKPVFFHTGFGADMDDYTLYIEHLQDDSPTLTITGPADYHIQFRGGWDIARLLDKVHKENPEPQREPLPPEPEPDLDPFLEALKKKQKK